MWHFLPPTTDWHGHAVLLQPIAPIHQSCHQTARVQSHPNQMFGWKRQAQHRYRQAANQRNHRCCRLLLRRRYPASNRPSRGWPCHQIECRCHQILRRRLRCRHQMNRHAIFCGGPTNKPRLRPIPPHRPSFRQSMSNLSLRLRPVLPQAVWVAARQRVRFFLLQQMRLQRMPFQQEPFCFRKRQRCFQAASVQLAMLPVERVWFLQPQVWMPRVARALRVSLFLPPLFLQQAVLQPLGLLPWV